MVYPGTRPPENIPPLWRIIPVLRDFLKLSWSSHVLIQVLEEDGVYFFRPISVRLHLPYHIIHNLFMLAY